MTTENSRADALTVAAALDAYEKASIAASECDSIEEARIAFVHSILAAPPVEQPAAAPIDERAIAARTDSAGVSEIILSTIVRAARKGKSYVEGYGKAHQFLKDAGLLVDGSAATESAPSPADERAAFEAWFRKENTHLRLSEDDWQELFSLLEVDSAKAHIICGRAKSDWKVWHAARAASANETGAEGAKPIGSVITVWGDGSWKSWSAGDAACAASDPDWLVNINAPQPAQADARVGLTDEQIMSVWRAAPWPDRAGVIAFARALLSAHPGQPEPRAEVTECCDHTWASCHKGEGCEFRMWLAARTGASS
ncbi:hypothetical protein [Burkholderia cepacia]|uniref:hypothetical protein n=1 Tax=Burkholderia cepacia TaxID=292 RepID=UPI001F162367|nr:hypothetical protein [Burkholderia cepacia]UIY58202.1 hypothetical protein LZ568_08305 [Burkholderia cepacia]UIY58285.1 hypothetical protein LZ568_08735 [Burkholderia cepacia]